MGFNDQYMYMIVGSKGENKVSDILRDFKKFTSKEIIQTLLVENTESRRDWMLNRFEYAGKNDKKSMNYRFWQEGNDILRSVFRVPCTFPYIFLIE